MSKSIQDSASKLTLGGAAIAALIASSCCVGPLVLAALGIGGLGAFVTIGSYRPYLLAVMAALLSVGFYLAYRRPRGTTGVDACGCDGAGPKRKRIGTTALWLVTFSVLAMAIAPTVLARSLTPARAMPASTTTQKAVLRVQGIDCEACAAPISRALQKVGGFHGLALNIATQSITVTYEPAPGRLEAYASAINDLGYEASLQSETAP